MEKLFVICMIVVFIITVSSIPDAHKMNHGQKEILPPSILSEDEPKTSDHRRGFDHEAILGSRNAANEFDQLDPKESKRRLRILSEKMDDNKDEHVDRTELTEWVMRSFRLLTKEEAMDQMEDEDGDNDGKVTWQEHVVETFGLYADEKFNTVDGQTTEEYKMFQNDKDLFKAADSNEDGMLDKQEYPLFSHPEEFEKMHQTLYKQTMQRRDRNNDGFLSFQEFIVDSHGISPHPTSEQYLMEKDRFINELDQDKDDKLNEEEVLSWLIPNNLEMSATEADHLIEDSDDDKDGKLSFDEIVNHHDVFVGSEATDFGEHLQNTHKFTDEL